MSSKIVNFRKSSSLIISSVCGKNLNRSNSEDYKVILLKRSKKMKAWPSFYVYPGGLIDSIDESIKWLSVLLTSNNTQQQTFDKINDADYLKEIFKGFIHNNSIGTLFDTKNNKNCNKLPAEMSFRLCAIRETFEETGILLAHDRSLINSDYYKQSKLFTNCYDKNLSQLLKWHKIVKEKPDEFINLFQDLNLVPDLSGLHEWSNWITPSNEKVRFNTVFFTCFLKNLPYKQLYNLDHDEIEILEELTPGEVLNRLNEIKLVPPQIYELKRMLKFKNLTALAEYSQHRQHYGLQPWLPKINKQLTFGVLPGDHLYEIMSEEDERSVEELLKLSNLKENVPINRLTRSDLNSPFKIQCNFELDGIN